MSELSAGSEGANVDGSNQDSVRRTPGSAGGALNALRTRALPRRILTTLTILMLLAGGGLLAYPFATNMFADMKQGGLQRQFGSESIKKAYVTRTVPVGDALTRLVIPKLGVDTIVVEGTTISALRAGSGHYRESPLPCEPGNSAIAGHRTTYSKPFAAIDRLTVGDEIVIETPVGKCWYRVSRAPWVTDPWDWSVARELKGSHLTLTTCHPPGSAAERLIVRAKLVRSEVALAPPSKKKGQDGKPTGKLPGPT